MGTVTDVVYKRISGKGSIEINSILGSWADGVGKCDLVKLEIIYVASKEKLSLKFGVCESGCSASVDFLCMKENGVNHISNAKNFGERCIKLVVPESNISRQIRPVSSNLMMMTMKYDVSDGIDVMFAFHLSVSTIRMHYLN